MTIDPAGIVFVVGQLFTHYCNCYHTTSIATSGRLTMLLTLSGKGKWHHTNNSFESNCRSGKGDGTLKSQNKIQRGFTKQKENIYLKI